MGWHIGKRPSTIVGQDINAEPFWGFDKIGSAEHCISV